MTPAGALVLTGTEVSALMRTSDWLAAAATGFRAAADARAQVPPPLAIDAEHGRFHAKAARLLLDRDWVALKFNGNFPGNPAAGLPTVQGALLLCDGATGTLLAIIDSIELTLRRTAAATALAARYLANPGSRAALICGCGAQALPQIEALLDILPLELCHAWDQDRSRAEAFAERAPLPTVVVDDLGEAGRASDVIVTCTSARAPFLGVDHVKDGAFIAAVGADSHDKSEIAPALMARALVVADSLDQCSVMGDLHHAIEAGTMRRDDVHAELADLVAGRKGGRASPGQITLFDSTGIALQDVAAAALLYERGRMGDGRRVAVGGVR